MGRIGKVLGFERRNEGGRKWAEVKVDIGANDIVTAIYFPPCGIDEWPLPGDSAALVESPGAGNWICVGFDDPALAGTAEAGETILYSRSAPGTIAAKCHMKADGSISWNDGALVLGTDGVLTGSADGIFAGVSVSTHTHGYIDVSDAGSTPSETDPPNP